MLSHPLFRWRAFYSMSGTATVLRSNSAGSSGRLCVRGHHRVPISGCLLVLKSAGCDTYPATQQ
jgi:hypothetical protein